MVKCVSSNQQQVCKGRDKYMGTRVGALGARGRMAIDGGAQGPHVCVLWGQGRPPPPSPRYHKSVAARASASTGLRSMAARILAAESDERSA